jgi:hypothetical protein
MTAPEKQCVTCGLVKPRRLFHQLPPESLLGTCKPCLLTAKRRAARRARRPRPRACFSVPSRAVKLADAVRWLKAYLAAGPQPPEDIYEAGHKEGHTRGTLKRAKAALGVESRRSGFPQCGGYTLWWLPEAVRDPGGRATSGAGIGSRTREAPLVDPHAAGDPLALIDAVMAAHRDPDPLARMVIDPDPLAHMVIDPLAHIDAIIDAQHIDMRAVSDVLAPDRMSTTRRDPQANALQRRLCGT